NATIVSAQLELYYNFVIDATPMDISVHAVTSNWTEFGSTWNSADGIAPWNAAGGDFDPTAVATVAGITNGTGWYGWNVTSLVVGWWTSAVPDDGLMVRQVSDTSAVMGQKGFSSSEDPNTTRWPRLQLAYTTPSSHGRLLSAPVAASGPSCLPASRDQDLSAALVHGIRLQITFATNDTLVSPRVESVTLRYRIASGALGNPAVSWGIAFFAFLTLLVLLRLRWHFAATGLLLIHADGRVVGNAGADGPRDEVATSAMLTLVHQFVRDSFQGPQGTGGELK